MAGNYLSGHSLSHNGHDSRLTLSYAPFAPSHLSACNRPVFTTPAIAVNFTGEVIGVLAGDTIEVLHNHHPERIRLSGSFLTIPLTQL